MRILFVADLQPGPNSGAAGTEYNTIIALRNLGYHVDTIWANGLRHRIKHWNLHYLLELPFDYWRAIKQKIKKNEYDVIHINQPYAWYAARKLKTTGYKGVVVNRSHGWEPAVTEALQPWRKKYGQPDWRFPRNLFGVPIRLILEGLYPRLAVKWCDGTVLSTSYDQKYLFEKYSPVDEKVAVIPQAPSSVFLDSPVKAMCEERLKKILYVGQTAFFKAPMIGAEVFSRLAECNPALQLTWCCQERYHDDIKSLLKGPAKQTINLTGWVSQQKLLELYDSHGIFIFPSFYEGFGKVFLESMARGCIPVCSDTGGMRDVIANGENGFLAPVGDAEALALKVNKVTSSLNFANDISLRASLTAHEYSWDRLARELAAFYNRLKTRNRD